MLAHLICVSDLHDPSQVHDRDTVRNMPHDEQIVRDKQVRNAQLFLQLLEHIDDLRLN